MAYKLILNKKFCYIDKQFVKKYKILSFKKFNNNIQRFYLIKWENVSAIDLIKFNVLLVRK